MPIPTGLAIRLAGGLLAALLLVGLWFRGNHYRDQRDALQLWKGEVVDATRSAAHRPRLAENQVAKQIRYLGEGLDNVRVAMATAKAEAIQAKADQERRDEDNRRRHDANFETSLADIRRRFNVWADAHRVPNGPGPRPTDRGNNRQDDLPLPSFGPQEPNGSGANTELVAIPRTDFDICNENTARIIDAQSWDADRHTGTKTAPESVPGAVPATDIAP